MKRLIYVFLLILLTPVAVKSQELGNQYFNFAPIANPGLTGIDPFLDLKIGYNQRWAGFKNAPNSKSIAAFSPLGNRELLRKSFIRTSQSSKETDAPTYDPRSKHAVGGFLNTTNSGIFDQVSFSGMYAVHIPLSKEITMSFGTSVGYRNTRIDPESIQVRNPDNDQIYQEYLQNSGNESMVSIDLGGSLYAEDWFVGVSAIDAASFNIESVSDSPIRSYLNMMGGYKQDLGMDFDLKFSGLVKYYFSEPAVYQINVKTDYKEIIQFATGYLSSKDIFLYFGITPKNFMLGYSYEQRVAGNGISNASHNIVLGVKLNAPGSLVSRVW